MKRHFRPTLVSAILLGLSAVLLIGTQASSQPSFSRSRWIDEQKAWGARFSGDPDRSPLPVPAEKIAVQAPARAPGPRSVRVSSDVLDDDGGPAQPETQTEPHLAINPERDTHLLAGYQEGRFRDGGARALTWAVSFDAGHTWQEGLLPGLTRSLGGRFERVSDPWVAFGPQDRAYFVSLAFNETGPENGLFLSTSEDGGLSWSDPVTVHEGGADFDDKQAMTVDTRQDSPFQGRVYVGWDTVTASRQQLLRISHSTDGGRSFTPPVTIHGAGANIGILPLVGPQGVLHAIWLHTSGSVDQLVAARSTDGGETWSAPALIAFPLGSGIPGSRTGGGLPTAAIDPRNGHLYVAWQDERFSPGVDQVVLSRSTNGGLTWSPPQRVSDGPLNAASFTPAVAVTANGVVGVAYYSLRNDPSRSVLADVYLAVSRNGGRRFARSLRVSDASWDLRAAAFSRGFFLGDYQGLAAGQRTLHPLWIGTVRPSRSDAGARQPDAFTRAMKVN